MAGDLNVNEVSSQRTREEKWQLAAMPLGVWTQGVRGLMGTLPQTAHYPRGLMKRVFSFFIFCFRFVDCFTHLLCFIINSSIVPIVDFLQSTPLTVWF